MHADQPMLVRDESARQCGQDGAEKGRVAVVHVCQVSLFLPTMPTQSVLQVVSASAASAGGPLAFCLAVAVAPDFGDVSEYLTKQDF